MTLGNKIRNQIHNPSHNIVIDQIRNQVNVFHFINIRNDVYEQTWTKVYDRIYDYTLFGKRYLTK